MPIRRAEVRPWEDLFQPLRRSCQIEWAQVYPLFAVSRWIGHSIIVNGKHYANLVPDELYDPKEAAQIEAQAQAERVETEPKTEPIDEGQKRENPADSGVARWAKRMPR